MPASTSAPTRVSVGPAPSSFTASAPPSFTNRIGIRERRPRLTPGYEPNGMSATTSGARAPRVTARVSISISSIVTGTRGLVAEHGHRRRVADEHDVDAGRIGEPRARRVVRGDHRDRARRAASSRPGRRADSLPCDRSIRSRGAVVMAMPARRAGRCRSGVSIRPRGDRQRRLRRRNGDRDVLGLDVAERARAAATASPPRR